jgi:hypothetical protein
MTAAPNIHKGTKGSMVATTATHPNHQAMLGRAPQGAGATIGMRTERAIGRARPPSTMGTRKMHSTPGAQRTRSLTTQPVSTRVIMTTIPSSQRGNMTQGWQGRKHTTTETTTPATGDTAYLGLADMLSRGGSRLTNKSKISSKLKWQPTSGKDKDKIKKILKNVLQVRGFHAFLFMTKDSCFVQMAHSVAKFATINPIAEDMDGKIFAFISDRLSNQETQAILIPTNAWTTWMTH